MCSHGGRGAELVVAARDEDIKRDLCGEGRGHLGKEGEEEKWEGLNTPRVSGRKEPPALPSLRPNHTHLGKQWKSQYLVKGLPAVLQASCSDIRGQREY